MKIRPGRLGSSRMVCRPMPPAPGCQRGPEPWPRSPGQLGPGQAAVVGAEQRGVLHAGVDDVRVGQRRLQVPDALELPGVLRAVVPLVGRERLAGRLRRVVGEPVALAHGHAVGRGRRPAAGRSPRPAAVVRALDELPEPAARLRRVDPIRIGGRAFHVVDLPAREVRAADLPAFPLAVRRQDERALARADQTRTLLIATSLPPANPGMLAGEHPDRAVEGTTPGDPERSRRSGAYSSPDGPYIPGTGMSFRRR